MSRTDQCRSGEASPAVAALQVALPAREPGPGFSQRASEPEACPASLPRTPGKRARDLVQQIPVFSRKQSSERQLCHLQPLLKETLTLLRAALPSTIVIRQHIAEEAGAVVVDPIQIHQVVMNLCTNAEYAMRDTGGLLEVDLEAVEVDAPLAAPHPGYPPGRADYFVYGF